MLFDLLSPESDGVERHLPDVTWLHADYGHVKATPQPRGLGVALPQRWPAPRHLETADRYSARSRNARAWHSSPGDPVRQFERTAHLPPATGDRAIPPRRSRFPHPRGRVPPGPGTH